MTGIVKGKEIDKLNLHEFAVLKGQGREIQNPKVVDENMMS